METWHSPRRTQRAHRYGVNWSARVRCVGEEGWHPGHIVNLSVTGVLLQTQRHYPVGERVEVEIDFLARPHATTIISGVGRVIREDHSAPGTAAIEFITECELMRKV